MLSCKHNNKLNIKCGEKWFNTYTEYNLSAALKNILCLEQFKTTDCSEPKHKCVQISRYPIKQQTNWSIDWWTYRNTKDIIVMVT